jgi:hypothetical protein
MADEPIATMVGIVVDASRMHVTKHDWRELLAGLGSRIGQPVPEIHAKDLYRGRDIWRNVPGKDRAQAITDIFKWLVDRRHDVIYTSVVKQSYEEAFAQQQIPDELNTIWRFMGFHLVLAIQKRFQRERKPKGHTILIFDNKEREQVRFTDIILRPRPWSDRYYHRGKRQDRLDQIVDVPYFGDSKDVALIQLADLAAFLLRCYAEVKCGLVRPKYVDEEVRLSNWMPLIHERALRTYVTRGRQEAEDLFWRHAPAPIREL